MHAVLKSKTGTNIVRNVYTNFEVLCQYVQHEKSQYIKYTLKYCKSPFIGEHFIFAMIVSQI